MFQAIFYRSTLSTSHRSLRAFSSSSNGKIVAPPMVYIKGEEMTAYAMALILDKWVKPHIDISKWQFFDLSCKNRDVTDDRVLKEAVEAGKKVCSIFKEPTITPSNAQKQALGLKKAWGSPNGLMRKGWNGITISRDTIHIEGVSLGYKKPVFFERHAVGGEYGAGWSTVGKGRLMTTFFPDDMSAPAHVIDARKLEDVSNVAVVYHNPLDNVKDLGHHFFSRCLEAKIVPYVVTKKTVFKWQEGFWQSLKEVFDTHYKKQFIESGLLSRCGNELQHLISDAATMQIIRWTEGGFGMAAHNYDGDMLTDEISQVHRSPGFITSTLVGKRDDGVIIKEFEASHGTVADMWRDHLQGKETSLNPLGIATALIGAMKHSGTVYPEHKEEITNFSNTLEKALHQAFSLDKGTRDMSGPQGYTTEDFIDRVAYRLERALHNLPVEPEFKPIPVHTKSTPTAVDDVDREGVIRMFQEHDADGNGAIDLEEFIMMLKKLNVAPKKNKSS